MKFLRKTICLIVLSALLICILTMTCACFLQHIEDTNGDEDYSLCSITEERLRQSGTSSIVSIYTINRVNNRYSIKAQKMSGVKDIYTFTASADVTYSFSITANVTKGNLRVYFLNNGTIVKDVEIGKSNELTIEEISGKCELRVAGESATFSVELTIL